MGHVLCLGEAMVELRATPTGFDATVAGDAFNTAAWLARGGVHVTHAQDLGEDLLHERLSDAIAQRGLAWVGRRHHDAANGMYVVDVDDRGERRFQYFRAGSAAGRTIDAETVDALAASAARHDVMFLTGVTVAVTAQDAALDRLLERIDVPLALAWNVRSGLHRRTAHGTIVERDTAELGRRLDHLSARAAVVIASEDDLALGLPGRRPADLARAVAARGGTFVLTKGPAGAVVWHGDAVHEQAAVAPPELRDTTGAGDAFAAGFLGGRLAGQAVPAAAAAGAAAAAEALSCRGALPPL